MTLTTHDFAASPLTEWVIDIPTGTIVTIDIDNVSWAGGSGSLGVYLSSGGTVQSIDYRRTQRNASVGVVADTAGPGSGAILSNSAFGIIDTAAKIFNMNTLAPVQVFSQFQNVTKHNATIFKSVASWNQLIIKVSHGGSINAGNIRVNAQDKANTVRSKDFGAASSANWNITDITPNQDELLILGSYDLGCSVATAILGRVSTNGGSTWNSASTDYLRAYASRSADDVDTISELTLMTAGGTSAGMCAMVMGLTQLIRTMNISYCMTPGVAANSAYSIVDTRNAIQVEDAFQIFVGSGVMNAGKLYAVGYAM